jgi:ArsR family transcriptional regulator
MKTLATTPLICCAPGAKPLPVRERERLASCFKALADPARVGIVNMISAAGEVCVCNLVDELGLSQPTVSHHLKILREAGLVDAERRGTWAFYRLVPENVEQLSAALAS